MATPLFVVMWQANAQLPDLEILCLAYATLKPGGQVSEANASFLFTFAVQMSHSSPFQPLDAAKFCGREP
jgi:hypothetical protein